VLGQVSGVCGAPTCTASGSPCLSTSQCCFPTTCSNGQMQPFVSPDVSPDGGATPDGGVPPVDAGGGPETSTGGTCK
jgi:hypothetical protein